MKLDTKFWIIALLAACTACSQPADSEGNKDPAARQQSTEAANGCVLDPPDEAVMCTADWTPVCGCDGKTYSNACNATAAGVPESTPGECDKRDRKY